MKYFIGLDAHSKTSTFAVVDENGQCTHRQTVDTTEKNLAYVINQINGERHLTFEESTISQWLYIQLKEHVDKLTVCNPVYISKRPGAKTDFLDALHIFISKCELITECKKSSKSIKKKAATIR